MEAKLPDGTVITGTPEEIQEYLDKGYNPKEWYLSKSRGWTLIKDMHANHLRNAILRGYQDWLDNLKPHIPEPATNKQFVEAMLSGPTDITLVSMMTEVGRRKTDD